MRKGRSPAKAGVQAGVSRFLILQSACRRSWAPACAGERVRA